VPGEIHRFDDELGLSNVVAMDTSSQHSSPVNM